MTNKFNLGWFEDKERYDAFIFVVRAAEKLMEIRKVKDIVFYGR